MSKVIVTGASGFVGKVCVRQLANAGREVTAAVSPNAKSTNVGEVWPELDPAEQAMISIQRGDLCDVGFTESLVGPDDQVLHLAGLGSVPQCIKDPRRAFEMNVGATQNLLEAARKVGVSRFLCISSAAVYGPARELPITESAATLPRNPYSASKLSGEALALSYHGAYAMPVVVVRPFNLYGPAQMTDALLPSVLRQLKEGADELLVGDLSSERDMLYVDDAAEGLISLLEAENVVGAIYNLCSGQCVSMQALVDGAIARINPEVVLKIDPARLRPKSAGPDRIVGSSDALQAATGWRPKTGLEAGLDACAAAFA